MSERVSPPRRFDYLLQNITDLRVREEVEVFFIKFEEFIGLAKNEQELNTVYVNALKDLHDLFPQDAFAVARVLTYIDFLFSQKRNSFSGQVTQESEVQKGIADLIQGTLEQSGNGQSSSTSFASGVKKYSEQADPLSAPTSEAFMSLTVSAPPSIHESGLFSPKMKKAVLIGVMAVLGVTAGYFAFDRYIRRNEIFQQVK